MNAALLVVALSAVGIDHGWQPLPDGGVEYILQIEPQMLETLRSQNDVESYLPPGLNVKKIRVTVGNAKLPKDAGNDTLSDAPKPRDESPLDATETSADEPAAFDAAAKLASASEIPEEEPPFARRQDRFNDRASGDQAGQENGAGDPALEGDTDSPLKKNAAAQPRSKQPNETGEPQDWEANKQPSWDEKTGTGDAKSASKKGAEAEKAWLPLTVTALALCLSLAANFYLAWIARDARQRYRDLLDQVQSPTAAAA